MDTPHLATVLLPEQRLAYAWLALKEAQQSPLHRGRAAEIRKAERAYLALVDRYQRGQLPATRDGIEMRL